MNVRTQYIIAYDVQDNKKREEIVSLLFDYGLFRIQKSVFWGYLSTAELNSISFQAKAVIGAHDEDYFLATRVMINKKDKKSILINYDNYNFNDWEESGTI
ncbi:MAG: CRISPR-associated endonuclease Cas2 [Methylacidiphilales bacterium]|nr:CRISPR-associated endonuclease Cas2 [Candidatus Methylacidiphilales bacterium]